MEKHGYNNPQKMFFDPIATLLDWEGLQKDPDTVVNLNPDRVIIIDDYGKYPQAGKWHSSVVQCMWPPADCPGHYQWESPDEFVPPSSGNPNWQVPVMRILCRLLIDALYDRSLHMTQTNVTAAVKDINQKLQLTLAMVCTFPMQEFCNHRSACMGFAMNSFSVPHVPAHFTWGEKLA